MERYNFQKIEKKWRETEFAVSVKNEKSKKILLFRNVSLPFWQDTHGACKELHDWRCNSQVQIFEWV